MAHYMTRHLEASIDLLHGDRLVAKGERFEATDVDADYYIQRRKAVEAKEEPPAKKAAGPAATPAVKAAKPAPAESKIETTKPAPRAAAVQKPAEPTPAESMLTTTRDLPGPAQDVAKQAADPAPTKPDAAA